MAKDSDGKEKKKFELERSPGFRIERCMMYV